MPNNLNMNFSPAGQALGLGGMAGMGGFGFGDAAETPEERRKRLQQIELQRQTLTQSSSPATNSLFGSMTSTGLLR